MSNADKIQRIIADGKPRTTIEIVDLVFPKSPPWHRTTRRSQVYNTLTALNRYGFVERKIVKHMVVWKWVG